MRDPGMEPDLWATTRVTMMSASQGVLAAYPQTWLVLLCRGEMAVQMVFGQSVCPS